MSRPNRGSCWPCWPSRTGCGPWRRSRWAPGPWPRWPNGRAWSHGRRPGRSAELVAGGLLDGEAGKGYRVRTEASRRRPSRRGHRGRAREGDEGQAARCWWRPSTTGGCWPVPAARGKRQVVLDHLAGLFEPGRRYPEPEVNELLGRYHPDYALLRRYLVDDGFLTGPTRKPGRGRSRSTGAPAAPWTPSAPTSS